ncbi:aminoacetone oxidase family FAD-binding enzyme, partial [Candidatus Sumerlaeota bacterium]|nr:aminoacetone oxidase family FAD-binding enzyme [Candidatus Sumerlaeota bacterium]
MTHADIAIIGAGAAGLAAAIFAGEASGGKAKIVLLDGAKKPGAKILISGGGRCNVTNDKVTEKDFNGGPPMIIRKVLRAFDERRTIEWMQSLGVYLKLEPTGKYFPMSNKAKTVLDALVTRVEEVGVKLIPEARVTAIDPAEGGFNLTCSGAIDKLHASKLVLATGGCSIPKSGSDGWGFGAARKLGHTVHPTTPALVPLVLKKGAQLGGRFAEFSGVSLDARLMLIDPKGRILHETAGSLLFTHFGISGPAALDISRHWIRENKSQPRAAVPHSELQAVSDHEKECDAASNTNVQLCMGVPSLRDPREAEAWLLRKSRMIPAPRVADVLAQLLPARIAEAMAEGTKDFAYMTRERRMEIARMLARLPLPVVGDRGYAYAEVTAGGVD